MDAVQIVGPVGDVPPGKVTGIARYAVGNADGELLAVGRRCRHLGADLATGILDEQGRLVCPWHQSAYDVRTGRMTRGPQGSMPHRPEDDLPEDAAHRQRRRRNPSAEPTRGKPTGWQWLFSSRKTGRLSIAAWPNLPLWVWIATAIARRLPFAPLPSSVRSRSSCGPSASCGAA